MALFGSERFRSILPHDTPGTNFIMISNVLSFILIFLNLFPSKLFALLVSNTVTVWTSPWTFLTYPLVSVPGGAFKLLSFLASLWCIYVMGGFLERTWGTRRFLIAFFVFSGISAFFIALGAMVTSMEVGFGELFCPIVDLMVIWASLEPMTPVVFFVFAMQLRWLAVIFLLMLLFDFGNLNPILGFFAMGGSTIPALYVRYLRGNPLRKPFKPYPGNPKSGSWFSLNPFEWYRRWRFKRRFKKLWGD